MTTMNNVVKVEKREKIVKTNTEKHYITEDFFYAKLKEADIHFCVNWDSNYAFKYSRSPKVISTTVDGKNIYGRSEEVSRYEVDKVICDAIGVRGKLVINTFVEEEDDCYCQHVSEIYILKEKVEVLQDKDTTEV